MRDGDDLDGLLVDLPDEIHRWISDTRAGLRAAYDDELSRASSVFEQRPLDADRKTIAQYFAGSDANLAVLFRMLDGNSFDDLIWKAIRPEASTPGQADRTGGPIRPARPIRLADAGDRLRRVSSLTSVCTERSSWGIVAASTRSTPTARFSQALISRWLRPSRRCRSATRRLRS